MFPKGLKSSAEFRGKKVIENAQNIKQMAVPTLLHPENIISKNYALEAVDGGLKNSRFHAPLTPVVK